ncbi:MAG: hypothetical protein OEZ14_16485 [Acidimicrobiia bacterium]|nr:hypothetical protein [Acidimicrobiia bacterium]MDH5522119.1 hypothetical protein [Acidimicrobiia bacterium]
MAIIDIPGFVAELKEHAMDHQFHIHDERHFIETYSMRQAWEVDLHPERACGGPLDLHLSVDLDPRTVLAFEDHLLALDEDDEPETGLTIPLMFTWILPPLTTAPDLLLLATELAGVGGANLPLRVAAIDSTAEVTDAAERTLSITAALELRLDDLFMHRESLCEALDDCYRVSEFLLDRAPAWLGEF